MKKRLLLTIFVAVLLLASLTAVFAAVESPGGGGTVPAGEYQVWLPVVGNTDVCGVSDGEYVIYHNRQGDPFHAIHYRIGKFEFFGDSTVVVARDFLLQDVVGEGGVSGIIPGSMYFTLPPNGILEIGQTYYARMTYTCTGILAQTPVLTFVAIDPFTP